MISPTRPNGRWGAPGRPAYPSTAAQAMPQDIEWASEAGGALWIRQARRMTALPPEVSWACPAPGVYSRSFRFGEWLAEPPTPLFESWLLSAMEDGLHDVLRREIG